MFVESNVFYCLLYGDFWQAPILKLFIHQQQDNIYILYYLWEACSGRHDIDVRRGRAPRCPHHGFLAAQNSLIPHPPRPPRPGGTHSPTAPSLAGPTPSSTGGAGSRVWYALPDRTKPHVQHGVVAPRDDIVSCRLIPLF